MLAEEPHAAVLFVLAAAAGAPPGTKTNHNGGKKEPNYITCRISANVPIALSRTCTIEIL